MGCGMSTEEKEGKARNEEIENQLKRDRLQQRNEIKMLLLGTLKRGRPSTGATMPAIKVFFFFFMSLTSSVYRSR